MFSQMLNRSRFKKLCLSTTLILPVVATFSNLTVYVSYCVHLEEIDLANFGGYML